MEKVGFIGVGTMGSRMLKNILLGGYEACAFDVEPKAAAFAQSVGAVVMPTPCEVAKHSDIVITMLPNYKSVEEVVFGENSLAEGFQRGALLIEMSSSLASSTQRTAERLKEMGIATIDAPVSGGSAGAEKATLSIAVGGEEADIERARPLLMTIGNRITRVGGVGMGHTAKAVNNMLFGTTLVAACEALALGVKAGIAPETLVQVIQNGSGQCYSISKINNFALAGNFVPGFSLDLLIKDVNMALSMGESERVPLPVSHVAREFLMLGQIKGWGGDDNTKILKMEEEFSGLKIRIKKQEG